MRLVKRLWMSHHYQAAASGGIHMCKCVIGEYKQLLGICNHNSLTPLYLAAVNGKKDAFHWLDYCQAKLRMHKASTHVGYSFFDFSFDFFSFCSLIHSSLKYFHWSFKLPSIEIMVWLAPINCNNLSYKRQL